MHQELWSVYHCVICDLDYNLPFQVRSQNMQPLQRTTTSLYIAFLLSCQRTVAPPQAAYPSTVNYKVLDDRVDTPVDTNPGKGGDLQNTWEEGALQNSRQD